MYQVEDALANVARARHHSKHKQQHALNRLKQVLETYTDVTRYPRSVCRQKGCGRPVVVTP